MPTFSFKNKGGYWSTRYTYNAFNFSKINRDLISVPMTGQDSLWLHGPKSKTGAEKTSYYDAPPAGSSLKFTFNQNVSANKIYKNMSLEGSIGPSNITSASLTINDSTDPSQLRPTNLQGWEEKGAHLHANVGKNSTMTRSTITPVGRIKGIYQLFFSENQGWHPSNATGINSFGYSIAGIPQNATGGIWGWGFSQVGELQIPGFGVTKTLPQVINDEESLEQLNAEGQEYLAQLYNIDRVEGWDNQSKSPYLFIEVDFFGNYRGSSKRTKYLIKSGSSQGYIGIEDPYSYSFDELPVFLDGYTSGLSQSPDRITFDTTPQEWTGDDDVNPGGYVQFGGKTSKREGILCTVNDEYPLSICAIKWPTITPGTNVSACDLIVNDFIQTNDLLEVLSVFGSGGQPPNVPIEFAFEPTVEFWDEVLGELLINFGAEIGSIGAPGSFATQITNTIQNPDYNALFTLYAATPGEVDGEYARGNYMDMTLKLKGNFELDVVNLDYEPTTLDHSR